MLQLLSDKTNLNITELGRVFFHVDLKENTLCKLFTFIKKKSDHRKYTHFVKKKQYVCPTYLNVNNDKELSFLWKNSKLQSPLSFKLYL